MRARRWIIATAVFVALAGCSGSQAAPGGTTIPAWKHGAAAAVSITMDDGYANQWRCMAPLLASHGFTGTFFVVTQWLDQEDLWDRWKEVAREGHEVGSHGLTHVSLAEVDGRGLTEELAWSRNRIKEMLGPGAGDVFAYPFSVSSDAIGRAAEEAGYVAARTGGDTTNPPAPADLYLVRSRHPLSGTSLDEMTAWVDDLLRDGGWLVIGVHGIRDPQRAFPPTQEGWEPVPLPRYAGLVGRLAAAGDDLWVAPFGEVARYVRAREGASVVSSVVAADRITVGFDGPAGGPPLTVETGVPDGWSRVAVGHVDGRVVVVSAAGDPGGRRVRYEVTPPEIVTLSPATSSR